jgi:hypothetical protein
MSRTHRGPLAALTLVVASAACSDSSAPGSGGQVSFNVAATVGTASPSAPFAAPDTLVDGSGNELVLTRVELVLRDIEFKRENDDVCDSLSTGDDDDCEEVEAGPLLLDLPLDGGIEHQFTVAIDTGTFDEIELKVHTPEDDGDDRDQAFLAAHPDLEDISIRVTGTFNGTSFTFTTDLNEEQEFELDSPLVITAESEVSVTLRVDLAVWFLNGGELINPVQALKGGTFEGLVKDNIEASFDIFQDDDHDGDH